MCVKCVEAVREFFPAVAEKDYGELLYNATCYPFGGPEDVARQLREMYHLGITTVDAACAYACDETDKAMRHVHWMEDAGYLAALGKET